jgi:hypothetical protein
MLLLDHSAWTVLPYVEITPGVEQLARGAQSDLARVGHHRFRSEWLAPAGSLD